MEIRNDSIFCTKCGTKNKSESSFCGNCGTALKKGRFEGINLNKESAQANYSNDYINCDYTKEELNAFIGKNQMFYLEKFDLMNRTNDKKSWNWSSFLCSAYWLLYRKMYLQALIYILAGTVLACIPVVGWILNIAVWIGLGVYGNSLYLDHINKKFREINCADKNLREMLIHKKGRTNIVIPLVILFIPIILLIIFAVISFLALGTAYLFY